MFSKIDNQLLNCLKGENDMTIIDNLGLIAGGFSTGSLIPQLIRIIKIRSTKDISLGMFSMSFVGLVLWLIFGILIKSKPIMISNILSITLVLTIISYKLKYK